MINLLGGKEESVVEAILDATQDLEVIAEQLSAALSCNQRISTLLGSGGVQQVKDALALDGKSLAKATDKEVNGVIKNLRSVCPGNVAWKRMSTEEESQDESLGNKFDEYTGGGKIKRRGSGVWRRNRLSWA